MIQVAIFALPELRVRPPPGENPKRSDSGITYLKQDSEQMFLLTQQIQNSIQGNTLMLNIKSQLFVVATLIAGSFGFTSSAFAGEGGVAGSASFQLSGGAVTQASVAVAVGKSSAYAGAATGSGNTEAFAAGTGGKIDLAGNGIYIQSIDVETAANLVVVQGNQLDNNTVDINVLEGKAKVDNVSVVTNQ